MTHQQQEELIYHILSKAAWMQAQEGGSYAPETLEAVGFIHCSTLEQVLGSAQGFFKGQDGLLLLTIDASAVDHEILFEDLAGEGMLFPHIYSPLNLDAVLGAAPLLRNKAGDFILPEEAKRLSLTSPTVLRHLTPLPYPLPGIIYRSPMPFSPLFDPQGQVLDAFHSAGVQVVVMLTPKEEVKELTGRDLYEMYRTLGFEIIYVPVEDFSIPDQGVFQVPIQQTLQAAQAGKTIVMHCHAGIGRTGAFAACLTKVIFDMDGPAAIRWVRQYVPRAVESPLQAQFVEEFQMED